jgi:hypothetical protein
MPVFMVGICLFGLVIWRIRRNPQSLWFAWLIITAGDLATIYGTSYTNRWDYFPNALFNLFTPILFWNLVGPARRSVLAVTLPLLFIGLFAGDLLGKRIKLKSLRLAYNLFFLFVMTVAVDVITWGSPKSIEHISEAYACVAARPKPPWCVVEGPNR